MHAKLGVSSGMWEVTTGCESCTMEGPGRGAGGRRQGQSKHTRTKTRPIGGRRGACGARPRCRWAAAGPEQAHAHQDPPDWRPPRSLRGLAGLRDDAPSHTPAPRRHWCGGRRSDRRARAGFEIDHSEPQARVWRSRGRPGPTAPGTPVGPHSPAAISGSQAPSGSPTR